MRCLLRDSRHVYCHQNTARRTGTRLERQHCATLVFSFVVLCTRVVISLCAALSRIADVIVVMLTVQSVANVVAPDEAHFWLNGYFNKQNCRIWSEANPQAYVETPLHPEKLTVWCALWAGGIIGPYFFKNDEGHNVTVNGDR
ncbi:transposable element Tc3 transposase [Trichonephila clavipes]|nr:transposable element Tc3 transposase [Trichonephila clavipes]